jgi:hypothetical protein
MYEFIVRIGDHHLGMNAESEQVAQWITHAYDVVQLTHEQPVPDLHIEVSDGYGSPFIDHQYTVHRADHDVVYERRDYRIVVNPDCTEAALYVNNDFSFRHAMMNLYSTLIVHSGWGLLIHSSCAVDGDEAVLFSGRSGAGKSTAARLSAPRTLLSDEASIVRICPNAVDVFDSPFRSETKVGGFRRTYPLKAIHLLIQSPRILRRLVTPAEAMLRMMDKAFYWTFESAETLKVMQLQASLLQLVPVYELEFQKNNRFWEVISWQNNIDGVVPQSLPNSTEHGSS